jgi:hypothetical protein
MINQQIDLDTEYIYQYRVVFRGNTSGKGLWNNCTYNQYLMYKELVNTFRTEGHSEYKHKYSYDVRILNVVSLTECKFNKG